MENVIFKKQPLQLSVKAKEWIVFFIGSACVFLFIYTAYSKLTNYDSFKIGLTKLPVIADYANYIAWLIPISEIVIAILIVLPQTNKIGLYAFTGLLLLFTSYLIALLLSGLKLPCSCGGVIQSMSWSQHFWFNLGIIALGLTAILLSQTKKLF